MAWDRRVKAKAEDVRADNVKAGQQLHFPTNLLKLYKTLFVYILSQQNCPTHQGKATVWNAQLSTI